MKIGFHGAAGTVTGSKHLLSLHDQTRILLDCGMFQGLGADTIEMNQHWGFDPRTVDHLILTHAHIDHSGLVPKLVHDGFSGKIYCTAATYDLCSIMLMDSAHIQEADTRYVNKRKKKQGKKPVKPLYTKDDVAVCLEQFHVLEYDQPFQLNSDVEVTLINNGHILGSAGVFLKVDEEGETTSIFYTGDIGRYGTTLLKDPFPFPQSDVIICESTYGNRLHTRDIYPAQEILDVVMETCGKYRGKVIIPAFSLGRTQEVVYALNKLDLRGLLPHVEVYVDSPLAVNATEIMRKYVGSLNADVQRFVDSRPDPFGFDWLTYITEKEDSQRLNHTPGPYIVISASGMAEAGRVKHHIKHAIDNRLNTILLVGYAEPHSLAGRLKSGEKHVRIFGQQHKVKAKVVATDALGAHGDHEEMIRFLSCQDPQKVRKVYLVHGDPEAQTAFKGHLSSAGFQRIYIPKMHEECTL